MFPARFDDKGRILLKGEFYLLSARHEIFQIFLKYLDCLWLISGEYYKAEVSPFLFKQTLDNANSLRQKGVRSCFLPPPHPFNINL